jgi:Ca2+-binding EF-hand superfamily protein
MVENMKLLKRFFEHLDSSNQGVVGVRELEEPLVSVGLATSRDDTINLVAAASKDGSDEIRFDEFLGMAQRRGSRLQVTLMSALTRARVVCHRSHVHQAHSGSRSQDGCRA